MSHSRERTEKICLNCDAQLYGRYCHACGQENIEPRETFWSLLTHFFNDITHFDGKFFKTVFNLVKKPGFLPVEYVNGRRARYLHPIRLYLFTSFVFFLVFYSINKDSLLVVNRSPVSQDSTLVNRDSDLPIITSGYPTVEAYHAAQMQLPESERDGWISRKLAIRSITMSNKYKGRSKELSNDLVNGFIRTFPTLLFITLPLYALYLKLLYRKHRHLYADHAIFLIYLYIFTFVLLLLFFLVDLTSKLFNVDWIYYIKYPLVLYGIVYAFISIKRFYQMSLLKTFLKFLIFNIFAVFSIISLFVIFFLLTFFRV